MKEKWQKNMLILAFEVIVQPLVSTFGTIFPFLAYYGPKGYYDKIIRPVLLHFGKIHLPSWF